jgi:hypothetical protein
MRQISNLTAMPYHQRHQELKNLVGAWTGAGSNKNTKMGDGARNLTDDWTGMGIGKLVGGAVGNLVGKRSRMRCWEGSWTRCLVG